MFSSSQIQSRLERILPTVQKPGRYTGGELNQIVKNWESTPVKVALVFPEIYDLGMSNLGLAILYDQLNKRADTLAERAYSPWTDMEEAMRKAGIPLFSLESKHPLNAFNIIAISIPSEPLYTNVLNLLDLARIPVSSDERDVSHPLVLAGGHATFNPEPMHSFIDAFVIGEGEEVIHEIIEAYKHHQQNCSPRNELLLVLSRIWGVYVPALYQPHYNPDGTFSHLEKQSKEARLPVQKRIVPKLPPPVTRFVTPFIETVHQRLPIEIMRGCTRGCRFCHAGMVTRPVRERPLGEIITAIEDIVSYTGIEDIGLLSLSTTDYSHIVELIKLVKERFSSQHLTVSLPSLRVETFSSEFIDLLGDDHATSFTLAPEAATDRMRQIINKPIGTEDLLEAARIIFAHHWTSIKLYFMIGHPSETTEDVQAIAELCQKVLIEGRKIIGRRAKVNVSISTFVPKAHTPFQWVACDPPSDIRAKQALLRRHLNRDGINMKLTNPEETMLETWLARGDRKLAGVIYEAWKNGAKFDSWREHFKFSTWLAAFHQQGLDPSFYSQRSRPLSEVFPWDHISTGVNKKFLVEEYMNSQRGITREDCQKQCYACGILPTFNLLRNTNSGRTWKCPEVKKHKSSNKAFTYYNPEEGQSGSV